MSRRGTEAEAARPVAIVLGAAVWPGGEPSPTLRRRTERAVALWQSGEVGAILGCGGVGAHGPAEAEVICRLARAAGVPEGALFREGRSSTTEENLRYALPVLEGMGARQVVIVSEGYHLPRALLVARRLGLVARGAAPGLGGARPRAQAKAVLREIPAFVWYWWRGAGR
ncbi:YdcF family protein [Salipiger bermudensis]|uniref:YdcF family protein n=1 Tax=Salipiger bermudensis TaxID=344736 RepID=UPI001CD6B41C|nr:YdcF family protein [Salipiger bermudensis]MCA0964314.1 YdcF family protein [Salipiger bermudensis]